MNHKIKKGSRNGVRLTIAGPKKKIGKTSLACHNPARASTTARRIPRAHAKSDSIARRGRRTRHRAGDNPDDDARESRRSHFDNDERARGIEEDARHDDGERVRESDDDENDG